MLWSTAEQCASNKANLTNDGSPSSPSNTPAKVHDEDSIQHNIDRVAENGGPQGRSGVPQPPKYPLQCMGTVFAQPSLHQ